MTIYDERLLHLAEHLEKGKLLHDEFYFLVYSISSDTAPRSLYRPKDRNVCQTAGCAMGECPAAFPGVWKLRDVEDGSGGKTPVLVDPPVDLAVPDAPCCCANWFFRLKPGEYDHLFVPNMQQEHLGPKLNNRATKEQVAANIRRFVEFRQLVAKSQREESHETVRADL